MDYFEMLERHTAMKRAARRRLITWIVALGAVAIYFGWGIAKGWAIDCQVLLEYDSRNKPELVAYDGDFRVGHLRYIVPRERHAVIASTFIHPGYRGQGYSKALTYAMLFRDPTIESVSGVLVSDNLAASGLEWVRRPISKEECIAAIKRTPFYRSLARFGFIHVSECDFMEQIGLLQAEVSK